MGGFAASAGTPAGAYVCPVNPARGQRTFVVPSLLTWHAAGVVGGGGGCNFNRCASGARSPQMASCTAPPCQHEEALRAKRCGRRRCPRLLDPSAIRSFGTQRLRAFFCTLNPICVIHLSRAVQQRTKQIAPTPRGLKPLRVAPLDDTVGWRLASALT